MIGMTYWVTLNEAIDVGSIASPYRIRARPPRQPRRIIPCAVVLQPALFIPLLAGVAIAFGRLGLPAHGLIRGAAVGIIFFEGNELRVFV